MWRLSIAHCRQRALALALALTGCAQAAPSFEDADFYRIDGNHLRSSLETWANYSIHQISCEIVEYHRTPEHRILSASLLLRTNHPDIFGYVMQERDVMPAWYLDRKYGKIYYTGLHPLEQPQAEAGCFSSGFKVVSLPRAGSDLISFPLPGLATPSVVPDEEGNHWAMDPSFRIVVSFILLDKDRSSGPRTYRGYQGRLWVACREPEHLQRIWK